MFERVGATIAKKGDKVKSVIVKVKINSAKTNWRVADIQFQEGSVVTEYTEHVAEMERRGG